jgi:hypothetical protein
MVRIAMIVYQKLNRTLPDYALSIYSNALTNQSTSILDQG